MSETYTSLPSHTDIRPQVRTLENQAVGPLLMGGKAFVKFATLPLRAGAFAHFRSRRAGRLVDVMIDEVLETEPSAVVPAALYGGTIMPHFGHFVAESLHRLWPLLSESTYDNVPIAFHAHVGPQGGIDDLPTYVRAIWSYIGINPDRVILINEPILFERLFVPTQCSFLGRGWIDPKYIDLLATKSVGRRPAAHSRRPNLFIGRQNYLNTGSIIGEQLVASTLQKSGSFDVITPEDEDLADLVSWYEAADTLVFIEGSAIHALEFCRKTDARILIVCKGDSWPAREVHFGNMLNQKVAVVRYLEGATRLTPISALPGSSDPYWPHASSYFDLNCLLNEIGTFSGVDLTHPTRDEIVEAQLASLGRLVLDPRMSHKRMPDEVYGELLRELRAQIVQIGILS